MFTLPKTNETSPEKNRTKPKKDFVPIVACLPFPAFFQDQKNLRRPNLLAKFFDVSLKFQETPDVPRTKKVATKTWGPFKEVVIEN